MRERERDSETDTDRQRETHLETDISSFIACTATSWSLSSTMESILSYSAIKNRINTQTSTYHSNTVNTLLNEHLPTIY